MIRDKLQKILDALELGLDIKELTVCVDYGNSEDQAQIKQIKDAIKLVKEEL